MCMYMHACMCVCACAHMQVCVSIECARGQYQVSSLVTFYFLFDTISLTEPGALYRV